MNDAKSAMLSLNNVHVAGTVPYQSSQLQLDLVLSKTVGGGSLTVNGAECQIVANGMSAYMKGDASFWQQVGGTNADTAALLAGKWVTGFSGSDLQGLSQLANLTSFVDSLTTGGRYTKGTATKVNGIPVIPITDSSGNIGYIAAAGPPYVIRISNGRGVVTFDQFNTAMLPQVPTNAVNVNNLGG